MKFQEWEKTLDKENIQELIIPNYLEFENDELKISGYKNLKVLYAGSCALKIVDIDCLQLEVLNLNDNKIKGINLSKCPNLRTLIISNNSLNDIDVSHLQSLETLWCFQNSLEELDCYCLKELKDLNCSLNTFLNEIKLFGCHKLEILDADLNDIVDLNFPHLPELSWLSLFGNSPAPELTETLVLNSPKLEHLNIKLSSIKEIVYQIPLVGKCKVISNVRSEVEDEDHINGNRSEDAPTEWEQHAYERKRKEGWEKYFQQKPDETTSPDQEPVVEAANFKEPTNKDKEFKLTLSHMWMKGKLVIKDWPRLAQLNVGNNQLEELVVENCPNLIWLNYAHNKLKKEPQIINCPKLREENIHKENCGNWEAPEPPPEEEQEESLPELQNLKTKWEEVIQKILDNPHKYSLKNILKINSFILQMVSSDLKQKFIDLLDSLIKKLDKKIDEGYETGEEEPIELPPLSPKKTEPDEPTPKDKDETIRTLQETISQLETKIKLESNKKNSRQVEEVRKEIERTKEKIINSNLEESKKQELLRKLEELTSQMMTTTDNPPSNTNYYWAWALVIVGWIILIALMLISFLHIKKRKKR